VPPPPVAVTVVGDVGFAEALALAEEVRAHGLPAVAELSGRSLKGALKRADRLGSRYALILGDDELAAGEVTVKDLGAGEQQRLPRTEVVAWLKGKETV
jgi:histidyl-tRNA synthetase